MKKLYSTQIGTEFGQKEIAVFCGDILDFDGTIDILTTSAYRNSYQPTPHTVFRALHDVGISVNNLARTPEIDLRDPCHIWLSAEIKNSNAGIRRIGCVELIGYGEYADSYEIEQSMLNSICAYFYMLDMAAIYNVRMDTIVLPLLGSGNQNISAELMIVPLLKECISFLKRNSSVRRICFVELSERKANLISDYVRKSYSVMNHTVTAVQNVQKPKATAFISYSSRDKNIADNLCAKLESRGVRVWYAPRDVRGPYASAIVEAIERCTHFVVILSQSSIRSQHVLNEVDLAFEALPNKIKFKPLRIDNAMFTPSFKYYLSRQHWMDAIVPPLEERLNEFVDHLLSDL